VSRMQQWEPPNAERKRFVAHVVTGCGDSGLKSETYRNHRRLYPRRRRRESEG
jgi:hypothetical protein